MNLSQQYKIPSKNNNFVDFANAKGSVKSKRLISKKGAGTAAGKGKFNEGKPPSKQRRFLKKVGIFLSLGFLFSILIGILFVIGIVSVFSQDLPNIDKEFQKSINSGKETVIVDRNGKELYRLQGEVVKERVNIQDVPDNMKWAFLAAEDSEFYNHKGLNLFGLGRAFYCAIKERGRSAPCGGGSSITQQVIKNTTTLKEYSLKRKAKEAVLAMKAEQEYSKDQILELYVNVVPMGGTVQGVKTASIYMYGQEDLSKLSLAQMAYLAAIPNEPTRLSPLGGTLFDRQRSQARAEYVLNRMAELHDRKDLNKTGLTVDEINKAREELPKVVFTTKKIDMKAPHYVEYVLKQLDDMYADKVDEKEVGRDYVRGKGYKVVTAVDLDTQEMLEENMRTQIMSADFQKKIGAQTGAAVMMDPKTGEVLAMVGSRDFNGEAKNGDLRFSPEINEAIGKRSLGSTIKPIGYLSSFTQGYNPSTVLPDFELDLKAPGSTSPYKIRDYGGTESKYKDPYTGRSDFISMRTALKWSLNIPAVTNYYFANYTDKNNAKVFEDMYIKLSGNETYRGKLQVPSAAIGGVSTTLLDQVQAYSTMASEGIYRPKKFILEIKDEKGETIENFRKVEGKQVVDKKYTFLINDMNKHYWLFDSDPTLVNLNKTMDFGGKTGTADNEDGKTSDTAFVAYSPTFVMGVWAGNSCGLKCPINNAASGEDLYKLLYKPFLEKYTPKITPAKYYKDGQAPEGVKKVEVCNMTGNAKSDKCSYGSHFEWVADSAKPETMIDTVSITQCGDTELKASQNDKDQGFAQDKNYFVYKMPSPSLKYIQDQINTKKNLNPPAEECKLDRKANVPQVSIVSPENNKEYGKNQSLDVTVFATGDLPIQKVDLVIDNTIVKTWTSGPYTVTIPLDTRSVGDHTIKAIATDSRGPGKGEGESATVKFRVKESGVGGSSPTSTPVIKFPFSTKTPTPTPTSTPSKKPTVPPSMKDPFNF